MAHRAVLKTRRAQIVKRRRHNADGAGGVDRGQIRVALQADQAHFRTRQHPWIGRAMRLMAGHTAFETHRPVLERERSALVAMAVQASRLVRGEGLRHRGADTAVRIVAVDATHRAFRQLMMIGLLKLRPDIDMAARALFVDCGRLAEHEPVGPIRVHFVAGRAGDLILRVTALQAPDVGRLIQVAGETDLVGGRRREFRRIANGRGRRRFGMLLRGAMAGLAGTPLPATFRAGLDCVVGAFREGVVDILVADLADFRADVTRRESSGQSSRRSGRSLRARDQPAAIRRTTAV